MTELACFSKGRNYTYRDSVNETAMTFVEAEGQTLIRIYSVANLAFARQRGKLIRRCANVTFNQPDVVVSLQAIKLRNVFRATTAALIDVPDLDASFATGVNVFSRIRDRYRAHHLAVCQGIYLARMTRYSLSN